MLSYKQQVKALYSLELIGQCTLSMKTGNRTYMQLEVGRFLPLSAVTCAKIKVKICITYKTANLRSESKLYLVCYS
jgi:hypothetical protein